MSDAPPTKAPPSSMPPTGVITLMFTDIQASTALWEKMGESFRAVLNRHNALIREFVRRWDGYEIKSQGDSFMIAFERASHAIYCALDIQRALADEPWPPEMGELMVRIGVHTGEPFLGYDANGQPDFFGPMVNRAARVADAGNGGQTLISSAAYDTAQGVLIPDVQLVDLGLHRLRGLDNPEHLWEMRHPDLPKHHFAPLRTLDALHTNLPLYSTSFVGREQDLAELKSLLTRPATRLLTLVGFGGMGKTRTALQLAESCSYEFPDGVWWIELEAARDAQGMRQRIAYHLGLQLQPHTSVRHQLLAYVRSRHLLLVLDNTEQIADAGLVIQELLGVTPRLKCVVTSRRALAVRGEQVREVPPLPPSDAERLFVERACQQVYFSLSTNNAADITELCRRLEGVPLAIELAASRIAGMTPREVLNRLDERFRLLKTYAPDLPPRQRALRGAIDWSYDLLSDGEKLLFSQLAVFAGGFSLADAEAVCAGTDTFEDVMALRQHSLLRSKVGGELQQTRYLMLDALREYALEKLLALPDAGAAARQRHARHFLAATQARLREMRTPGETAAMQAMEADFDNVRVALLWAQQPGEIELRVRLSLALAIFLGRRGFHKESLLLVQGAQDAIAQLPGDYKTLQAALLREQASLHIDEHAWKLASARAAEAHSLFEQLHDAKGRADVVNLLGLAAKGEHEYAAARAHFTNALEDFERLRDKVGVAIVLNNLGLIEYEDQTGDKAEAMRYWQKALHLHGENGDKRGVAETLTNLGALAQLRDDRLEAWRRYEEALRIERELRHVLGVGRALSNLGELAESEGTASYALRLFAAAECLFDQIGSPHQTYTHDKLRHVLTGLRLEADAKAEIDRMRVELKEKSHDDLIIWALGDDSNASTDR